MKRFLMMLFTMFLSLQSAQAMNVDAFMNKHVAPISDAVAKVIFAPIKFSGSEIALIILWVVIAGIVFTCLFRGIAIWGFKHAIDTVSKPVEDKHSGFGEVSPFQALATALSGTIGIGSIAGVAMSISLGGPGAAFWIFVGAILGMSIKFIEATLAVKYRKFNLDSSVSGGPMHYIAHGLTRKKMRWLGQPLSVVYAIICIFAGITGGNMIQINQAALQVTSVVGISQDYTWVIGLIVAVLIGLVVMGGIKSIAKVTTVLTPTMCALYIISGLIVICVNITHIPHALSLIMHEAFSPTGVTGGILGVIALGLRRSVQSNEAGTGAAAIVYATAQTKEPVAQGFVALLETFLTGILCLLTSFVIIFSGTCVQAQQEVMGIELVSKAFASVFPFFPLILTVIAFLFALSTLISWAYYGQKAWTFLLGEGKKRVITFNIIYCAFIIVGAAMNVQSVLDITDAMMIALCVPNIIVLYILAPEIKKDLKDYLVRHNMNFMKF